jgi:transposase
MKAAPVLLAGLTGARYVLADKGYDANALRKMICSVSIVPVIPGRRNRKRAITYDKQRYRDRHLIENAFRRLKDFRRIAMRYDKLARNFLSTVALAAILAFWLGLSPNPRAGQKTRRDECDALWRTWHAARFCCAEKQEGRCEIRPIGYRVGLKAQKPHSG